jgi:diguanylate cyclase (GGDEF)-like protein/PAS domain S-box-containing protein
MEPTSGMADMADMDDTDADLTAMADMDDTDAVDMDHGAVGGLHAEAADHVGADEGFAGEAEFDIYGQLWRLDVKSQPGFLDIPTSNEATVELAGGIVLSVLLFGLVWSITRSRVHAQRRADSATADLRHSDVRFQTGFDNAPIGMALVDLDGLIIQTNAALCDLFGYSPDELEGWALTSFVHPDHRDAHRSCTVELVAGSASSRQEERRYVHSAGRDLWVIESMSIVRDEAGLAKYHFVQAQDITDQKLAEADLVYQALHDPLTGLPNRALFLDRLRHALNRSERTRSGVGVMFVDLDRFKVINDSLGHDAGDQLLIDVAARIQSGVRREDTVARFGGDEFVILCEDVDDDERLTELADRVLSAVRRPIDFGETAMFVTASIGITMTTGNGESAEALLRDADAAMYRAKAGGRDRAEMFTPTVRAQVVARLEVEQMLRHALEHDQLHVQYQPIVSLNTGRISGFETLVRWQHHERGLIPPSQFLPIADESNLLDLLDAWVLRRACRQLAAWTEQRSDAQHWTIAVNCSAKSLHSSDLTDRIAVTLHEEGLPANRLYLEITEDAFVDDIEAVSHTLAELHTMGVRIAIDDFGTGYSSLSYLSRLPIDLVKIDRSFVATLPNDQANDKIVAAVISMAHSLGIATVAEGVETAAQLEAVNEHASDFAQGNLLAKPQDGPAIADLVNRWAPPFATRNDS